MTANYTLYARHPLKAACWCFDKECFTKATKGDKKNHSSLFVLIQEAPHTPSVCVYFSFFYHTLPSTCMQPIPLICTQSHNSFHCFLVGLLSTLLALRFNFLLRAPLPTFSAMWDTCAWLLCQATESESHTQLVPRTNFIFFLISCLLWCQHFLIVPSQARSALQSHASFVRVCQALMYWLFSDDAQVVVTVRRYRPLCCCMVLLQSTCGWGSKLDK